jgi:DNA-binding protein HU-beta
MAGKPELVEKIAAESGLTKAASAKALDAVISAITSTLASGESVTLSGFGTFRVTQTAERMGRNPSNGQPMRIPASKRVGFSAGSKLSSAVKGS